MYNYQGGMFNCYKTQLKYLSNVWPSHAQTCREGKHSILTLKFPDIMTTISCVIYVDILLCLVNSEQSISWTDLPARARFSQLQRKVLPLMIWRLDIAQNHKSLRVTSVDDSCSAWWRDFVHFLVSDIIIYSKWVGWSRLIWTCDIRQLPSF